MSIDSVWKELSEDYVGYNPTTDLVLGYPYVEQLLGDVSSKRILDYGCGHGKFSVRLRELGARVKGFDISPEAIRIARETNSRKGVEYHLIENSGILFLEEGEMDAAVMNYVLCTIQDEAYAKDIFRQINRALRKDLHLF